MTPAAKRRLVYTAYMALAVLVAAASVDYSFYLNPSGLTISSSILPWEPTYSYLAAFAVASVNSLAVGLVAIVLATVLGVLIGIMGTWTNPTALLFYRLYVGAFRNVPVLFVILLCYFAGITLPAPAKAFDVLGLVFLSNRGLVLPEGELASGLAAWLAVVPLALTPVLQRLPMRGIWRAPAIVAAIAFALWLGFDYHAPEPGKFGFRSGLEIPLEFLALTTALSVYYAAEIAEITRGAMLSIHRGTIEASHALGLHAFDRFRKIVAPLAVRFGLPAALNTYLIVLKATSLGVAIGYTELFSVARLSMSSSGRIVECLTLMGLYFLLMCGTLSLIVSRINDKLKKADR